MAFHPTLEETLERLADRKQVLDALWRAVNEAAPSDLHPKGCGPRTARLAEKAVLLAEEYLAKYHRSSEAHDELHGENILAEQFDPTHQQPLLH